MKRWRPGAATLVLVVALALRVAVGLDAQDAPFWTAPLVDEVAYLQMAETELKGVAPEHGAYYMTPGYPWFLALMNLLGAQIPQIKWVQLLLGALNAWLIFLIGRRLFDRRVGWLAALCWMLLPAALLHELLILKPTLTVSLTLAGLWLFLRFGGRAWTWPVVGLCFGAAALLRGEVLVVATLFFAGAWWARRRGWPHAPSASWMPAAGWLMVLAVVAVPTGINLARGGGPVVVAYSGGVNFYIGNHEGADGSYLPLRPDRSDAAVEESDAVQIAREESGQLLRPAEVSRFWLGRGLEWWAEDPLGAVALTAKKAVLLWSAWEGHDVLSPSLAGRWVVALENPLVRAWLILPLALVGLGLSWRRRELWPLQLWLIATWLALVPFFVFERFRLPMLALGSVFAAQVLVHLYDAARKQRARSFATVVVAGLVTVGLLSQPSVARDDTVLHVNVGGMLLQQERYEEALEEFRLVRRRSPGAVRVEINIATALQGLGREREALRSVQRALEFLGREAEATGRTPVEEMLYGHVLAGDLQRSLGRPELARRHYEAAWSLRPGHPEIRRKLQALGPPPSGD